MRAEMFSSLQRVIPWTTERIEELPVYVNDEQQSRRQMQELTNPRNILYVAQWIGMYKIEPNPQYLFNAVVETERITGLRENSGYVRTKEGAITIAREIYSAAGRLIEVFNEKARKVKPRDIVLLIPFLIGI